MKLVKCIKVGSEIKVQPLDQDGFVQFPKDLREEGKVFAVEELVKSGKFWRVKGNIFALTPVGENTSVDNTYVEFKESNDHEGETWFFYIKKDEPLVTDLMTLIDRYKKLDEEEDCMCEYDYRELPAAEAKMMMKRKGNGGYMNEFNIITKIMPPKEIEKRFKTFADIKTLKDISDYLYKGRCYFDV